MAQVALFLEQLISAPLTAIVHAQKDSAKATLDFLLSHLVEKEEAGKKKKVPLSVEFSYTQALQDPETGKIQILPMKISIPVLTLVPLPYISVDEAEIEFKAKIVAFKEGKFFAVYSHASADLSAELNVKIRAKRLEVPEGIAKTITALSNSIPVTKDEGI
ncbi:MAG: DUF2589 domain-containing protein [Archaeoglobaceae archaeon]